MAAPRLKTAGQRRACWRVPPGWLPMIPPGHAIWVSEIAGCETRKGPSQVSATGPTVAFLAAVRFKCSEAKWPV